MGAAHLAAVVVRRRAARRGFALEADEMAERWGLAFALVWLVFAVGSEIVRDRRPRAPHD